MPYDDFGVDVSDGVAHVRFCNPRRRNALTLTSFHELRDIVDGVSRGGTARVVVLSGDGPSFCGGLDLSVLGEFSALPTDAPAGRAGIRALALELQDCLSALERARVPVVAAVQGACVGGALDLVTACDVRLAAEDAFFVVQEINVGLMADVGTLQRLPRLIPDGLARELAFTGRRLPATEALAAGLVTHVFPTHADLLAGADALAAEIAAKSPLAIWGTKETMNYARDHSLADSLNYTAVWQAGMFNGREVTEGVQALRECRPPKYEDLPPGKG